MENSGGIERISEIVGYRNVKRYSTKAHFVFDGLDLRGKRVLEIGCGKGSLVAWAALHGASFVLGLEPEKEGSQSISYRTLEEVVSTLCLNNIEISPKTFDEYVFSEPFDVVILYNVINHLDEQAVTDMHVNMASYERFLCIAEKLCTVTAPKGILILADAARSNLWGDLGRQSPFARTIEWKKHQNPKTWKRLFEQAGFKLVNLNWSQLYPLGKLSSNFLVHYITISHFLMHLERADNSPANKS
ncbi:MAG: methyltransferase domain-containing protein [Anaerolineales bacterium]